MQNSLFNEPNKILTLIKELAPNIYPSYISHKINKLETKLQELRLEWKGTTQKGRKNIELQAIKLKQQIEDYKEFRDKEVDSKPQAETQLSMK